MSLVRQLNNIRGEVSKQFMSEVRQSHLLDNTRHPREDCIERGLEDILQSGGHVVLDLVRGAHHGGVDGVPD